MGYDLTVMIKKMVSNRFHHSYKGCLVKHIKTIVEATSIMDWVSIPQLHKEKFRCANIEYVNLKHCVQVAGLGMIE